MHPTVTVKPNLNRFPPATTDHKKVDTTDSSNKISMNVPSEKMQKGTFWQKNCMSPPLLGAKAEHVTYTFNQTPQLPNYKRQ